MDFFPDIRIHMECTLACPLQDTRDRGLVVGLRG